MGVIRPPLPSDGYTIIPNRWMRDDRISWKAKGLLAYLMGHEPGYRISQNQMQRQATDGRDSLQSGLAELASAGYLCREERRSEGGRYAEDDYTITDPFAATGNPHGSSADRAGHPTSAGNPQRVTRDGSPVDGPPAYKKNKGEDHLEKITTGAPSEPGGGAPQLALVEPVADGPAERKRLLGVSAAAVTRAYVEAAQGMANYLAVLGIVKRALDVRLDGGNGSAAATGSPPRYSPERVTTALDLLREAGRPVTLQTLHAALESPGSIGSRRNTPYRDPAPADYGKGF